MKSIVKFNCKLVTYNVDPRIKTAKKIERGFNPPPFIFFFPALQRNLKFYGFFLPKVHEISQFLFIIINLHALGSEIYSLGKDQHFGRNMGGGALATFGIVYSGP